MRLEPRPAGWWLVALFVVVTIGGLRAVATRARVASERELSSSVPGSLPEGGYVRSETCRSCHPSEHASWHATFHRTMTQAATPDVVLGDFDGVHLVSRGRRYHLFRRGEEFWANLVDPEWEQDWIDRGVDPNTVPDPPHVDRRVVMTTGSHHMQAYWTAAGDGRFYQLPFTWLNEERRWVPREDVFLRPPDAPRQVGAWHDNCIECHSVGGEKGFDPETSSFDPRVGELGIACEACHGPAREHIEVNQDPLRRYRYRLTGEPDPTIVNPANLSAYASTQVCGQCHGMTVYKGDLFAAGERYRPGDDLLDTRMILRGTDHVLPAEREDWARLQAHLERQPPDFIEGRFWADGMSRISGRESNAMTLSKCFQGELDCLSCHSMHESDPNDQLAATMDGDEACFQCHGDYRARIREHTHHDVGSTGSLCYNCHMPHTTYGLLKGMRSHLIDSPSVAATVATGRPNACNLCHLDKTLRWSADTLSAWYEQEDVELDSDQETVSAIVLDVLAGDAGQRALAAWHLGWEPALAISGENWAAMYLGHLLDDPYAAVRQVAYRSLRRQPGFGSFAYDYVGPAERRPEIRQAAVRQWRQRRSAAKTGPELLILPTGQVDIQELNRLTLLRDDRRVELRE